MPGVVVVGRVVAVHAPDCRDVMDGAGRMWSLRGAADEPARVGDQVRWRVRRVTDDPCGDGTSAEVLSTRADAR